MDLFHDNPLFSGVRQMLAAFAKQQMRPIAAHHDAEESMPWALMKSAGALGLTAHVGTLGARQLALQILPSLRGRAWSGQLWRMVTWTEWETRPTISLRRARKRSCTSRIQPGCIGVATHSSF